MTNDLDVHMALLYAPSYQKQVDEKYYNSGLTTSQNCRVYTDLFCLFSKNDNTLDFLIKLCDFVTLCLVYRGNGVIHRGQKPASRR